MSASHTRKYDVVKRHGGLHVTVRAAAARICKIRITRSDSDVGVASVRILLPRNASSRRTSSIPKLVWLCATPMGVAAIRSTVRMANISMCVCGDSG